MNYNISPYNKNDLSSKVFNLSQNEYSIYEKPEIKNDKKINKLPPAYPELDNSSLRIRKIKTDNSVINISKNDEQFNN